MNSCNLAIILFVNHNFCIANGVVDQPRDKLNFTAAPTYHEATGTGQDAPSFNHEQVAS